MVTRANIEEQGQSSLWVERRYELSSTIRFFVNRLTPAELGVDQGEKWRRALPSVPFCTFESRDIRSIM